MDIHMEGNDSGTLVVSALLMATQLAPLFVFIGALLSVIISVVAVRKRLIGLATLFLMVPLALIVSSCFWFLALSTGENYTVATSVCAVILGLVMLSPFVVALMVVLKISRKPEEESQEDQTGDHTVCKG